MLCVLFSNACTNSTEKTKFAVHMKRPHACATCVRYAWKRRMCDKCHTCYHLTSMCETCHTCKQTLCMCNTCHTCMHASCMCDTCHTCTRLLTYKYSILGVRFYSTLNLILVHSQPNYTFQPDFTYLPTRTHYT